MRDIFGGYVGDVCGGSLWGGGALKKAIIYIPITLSYV